MQLLCLHQAHDLLDVADFNQNVLRLEVCVDHAACAMQEIQSQQELLGNLLDKHHGNAAVLVAADEREQVLAQNLENHANMDAVGALVGKCVQQLDHVIVPRMVDVGAGNTVQELDLVDGRVRVVLGTAHDLHGHVALLVVVSGQPHGGKMAPAKFPHQCVLVVTVRFANVACVVAARHVVLEAFFVLDIDVFKVRVRLVHRVQARLVCLACLGAAGLGQMRFLVG